jgi:omega-6 fatty acid desaturase (delta-12 desaturase)
MKAHELNVQLGNVAILVVVLALGFTIGFLELLLVYLPAFFIASAAGIWLFYVQHQFEGTYWESHANWDYETAALRGSSFYRLPRVLEWFTGRIGFHHVHHFDPRIPNYHLRRCHYDVDVFRSVPELTLFASFRSASLKLWDTQQKRLITFRELRRLRRASGTVATAGT